MQQGWLGQTLCFIKVQFTFAKGADGCVYHPSPSSVYLGWGFIQQNMTGWTLDNSDKKKKHFLLHIQGEYEVDWSLNNLNVNTDYDSIIQVRILF